MIPQLNYRRNLTRLCWNNLCPPLPRKGIAPDLTFNCTIKQLFLVPSLGRGAAGRSAKAGRGLCDIHHEQTPPFPSQGRESHGAIAFNWTWIDNTNHKLKSESRNKITSPISYPIYFDKLRLKFPEQISCQTLPPPTYPISINY